MSFKDILGHESAVNRLKALITGGRVPPALLFHGPEGIGKFRAAMEFAKALNCTHLYPASGHLYPASGHSLPEEPAAENGLFGAAPTERRAPDGDPGDCCGVCVSCSQADRSVHPDIRVIDSEFQGFLLDEDAQKQKILRIDTVREFTRYVYQKAILSKWKVFVVNDAHTLNNQAQNAMLKVLEEPPPDNLFILVAAKKNLLLPTIVSRSCAVEFKRLSPASVAEILVREGMTRDEASALGGLAGGSIKKAGDIKKIRDRLSGAAVSGPRGIFKLVSGLPREPYMAREEAKLLLDMLLASARKSWLTLPPGTNASAHAALIRKLLGYRRFLNQNVSHGLTLEAALLECDKLSISLR
jgi:DNA polymerase III delta prime subunit